MMQIYIMHEKTKHGERFKVVDAAHPFFRMPQIQGPELYMNRYEAEAEVGGEIVKIKIGSLTDFPVRHDPVLSDAIRNDAIALAQEGTK